MNWMISPFWALWSMLVQLVYWMWSIRKTNLPPFFVCPYSLIILIFFLGIPPNFEFIFDSRITNNLFVLFWLSKILQDDPSYYYWELCYQRAKDCWRWGKNDLFSNGKDLLASTSTQIVAFREKCSHPKAHSTSMAPYSSPRPPLSPSDSKDICGVLEEDPQWFSILALGKEKRDIVHFIWDENLFYEKWLVKFPAQVMWIECIIWVVTSSLPMNPRKRWNTIKKIIGIVRTQ